MDGTSDAVKRIIGIFIYYAILFILVTFAIGVNNSFGGNNEIKGNFAGFSSLEELKAVGGACDLPQPNNPFNAPYCSRMETLNSNATCSQVNGCSWEANIFYSGGYYCAGELNLSYYNGGNEDGINSICEATYTDLSKENCDFFGCTWSTYEELELNNNLATTSGLSTFTQSVKFITGFNVDIGVSGTLQFVVSLLFYIPLIILIISLYQLVPLI